MDNLFDRCEHLTHDRFNRGRKTLNHIKICYRIKTMYAYNSNNKRL